MTLTPRERLRAGLRAIWPRATRLEIERALDFAEVYRVSYADPLAALHRAELAAVPVSVPARDETARGYCAACGYRVALRKDGAAGKHPDLRDRKRYVRCEGEGQPPRKVP